MSDVVNFIRLKRDANFESLSELEKQAKERFELLPIFEQCNWQDDAWPYFKKSQQLRFEKIGGGELPQELVTLIKVYLVNLLWVQRLRAEPYSYSHVKRSIEPIKLWADMGIDKLSEIDQEAYDSTIAYLKDKYREPATNGGYLNRVVHYLNDSHVLNAYIDTQNIRKVLGNLSEYENTLAKKEKMPLPELVRAIIHLKWAVDDKFDGSSKAINSKLCILTQVFQYGLGLRVGEVLRLPLNPLVEMDGELFCRVWTEKGALPMARYVPSIWREPIKDAVDEIQKLTRPYREIAIQIEVHGSPTFIDERFNVYIQEKERLLEQKVRQLDDFLCSKEQEAINLWQLKKPIGNAERFELKDLSDILPISSNANDSCSLLKYYQGMGLVVVSESLGTFKNKHFVAADEITKTIADIISRRATYVTERELLKILNKYSSGKTPSSKDSFIREKVVRLNGKFNALTFSEKNTSKNASSTKVISRDDAVEILQVYVLGGYDHNKEITLKELENILPELFGQNSAGKSYIRKICGNKQTTFYVKHSGKREFTKLRGYLANIEKVKAFVFSEYQRMNMDVEHELIEACTKEYELDGVEISSKSFSVRQKPSEYLFLRAGMRGGQYYEHLPQILGYYSVIYFFGGNDKLSNAFDRYSVDVDSHIAETWQSHKGRHWQTTSLFRSGLAELVVNKWMGRTTGQGENYDHNTGRERAKIVAEAMLDDTERFLGDLPKRIKRWKEQKIPSSSLPEHLTQTLQSIQYSPLGYCTRALYLKPCEFNLKCLTGNEGKGCKHYIYDLHDPSHREKVIAERDRSSLELARLFEVYESGVEAAKMHIEHHMAILRNTTSILENAEIILNDVQLEELQDYMPFKKEGSYPDDCPFQCGGDE